MKESVFKLRKEEGVTLIALIVTVIVLIILAGISIAMLSGDNGIIGTANDSQVETELSQLQERLDVYKLQREAVITKTGDYSNEISNLDLVNEGILKTVEVKDPKMTVGIINLEKLDIELNLGNNYKNIDVTEIDNLLELEDVFVIDFETNDIYYIRDGEQWRKEGQSYGNSSPARDDFAIKVTPDSYNGKETVDIVVTIVEEGSGLDENNEYEYYLSKSSNDLLGGTWKEYEPGNKMNIGNELSGEYYIFIKQITDKEGNKSTGGRTVLIDGETYHVFGKYVFDNYDTTEYKITYVLDGGEVTGNPATYKASSETFTLKNPTKLGYEFLGWTGSNGNTPQKEVIIQKGSTGDRNYTANWKANIYEIAYNGNGSTSGSMSNSKFTYGQGQDLKSNEFAKSGYTFVGWNTKVDGSGISYSNSQNVINLTEKNNEVITLYAQWTANKYTVEYNGNGATGGSTASSSHVYDEEKALTANGYIRNYTVTYNYNGNGTENTTATAKYTFKNWNTQADGNGKEYTDKQVVENLTTGGTITLYAQWNSASVKLPTPTREGYTFTGWYDAATGGNKVGDAGASHTPTANKTLYAHWDVNEYTLTVNPNGGTWNGLKNSTSYTQEYGTTKTISNPSPPSYTVKFDGNGGTAKSSSLASARTFTGWGESGSGTLSGTTYTFGAGNGTLVAGYSSTGKAIALTTATRTGYTFNGWYTAKSGGSKVGNAGASYTPEGNITLYAQWTQQRHTVAYNANGGAGAPDSQTKYYGQNLTLSSTIPTRNLFTFVNWNTKADGTGTSYSPGQTYTSNQNGGTVTLYAIWRRKYAYVTGLNPGNVLYINSVPASGNVIGRLGNGDKVEIYGEDGNWWYVYANSRAYDPGGVSDDFVGYMYGYVYKDFITTPQ